MLQKKLGVHTAGHKKTKRKLSRGDHDFHHFPPHKMHFLVYQPPLAWTKSISIVSLLYPNLVGYIISSCLPLLKKTNIIKYLTYRWCLTHQETPAGCPLSRLHRPGRFISSFKNPCPYAPCMAYFWLVVQPLWKILVNGKDCPIYLAPPFGLKLKPFPKRILLDPRAEN